MFSIKPKFYHCCSNMKQNFESYNCFVFKFLTTLYGWHQWVIWKEPSWLQFMDRIQFDIKLFTIYWVRSLVDIPRNLIMVIWYVICRLKISIHEYFVLWDIFKYRTRAIISRGLYIFKDHFFVLKEVFKENYVLMYGLYSRAACNQERLMMARVRYIKITFWIKKGL